MVVTFYEDTSFRSPAKDIFTSNNNKNKNKVVRFLHVTNEIEIFTIPNLINTGTFTIYSCGIFIVYIILEHDEGFLSVQIVGHYTQTKIGALIVPAVMSPGVALMHHVPLSLSLSLSRSAIPTTHRSKFLPALSYYMPYDI